MPDGAKFCTNCGQKLYEEQKTEQPVQPQYATQQYPQGYYAAPQKKKSKAPLAVLLICLIVFIVGGLGFFAYKWVNSPDRTALKALASEDYDTVNYLYDDITQKTADAIKNEYRSKFEDMEQRYENGDLEYYEVYSFAVTASEKVLRDDAAFERLFDRLESIQFSRSEYKLAEEYFSKGMYSEALSCYMNVSVEDTLNYNAALDKIKACNDLMVNEITGTWIYTVDVKPLMSGFEFWNDPIYVDIYFIFDKDGSGELYLNYDSMMDALREPATELIERELEKQGLPRAYLDIMLKLGGYDDVMDAIKDFAPDESAEFLNGEDIHNYFIYNVDGDTLIINGYSKLTFELNGDYLTILSDDNDLFGFADLKLKPPYTLIRTYG